MEMVTLYYAHRSCKFLRVRRQPVAVPTGSDREIYDLGRSLVVGPHGADLIDEDPVTGAIVGPFEPYWLNATGFDDQSDADVR